MAAVKESYQTRQRLKKLGNRWWRLNNLYWILTEQGEKVRFKCYAVQRILYFALWWLNIIPKSRQHGITTFIAIFILDFCLFNSNTHAGIIAHKLEDAKKIFRNKIKFAYDNLPDDLKEARRLVKDDAQQLELSNGSTVYVGTSMRSGTLQILHISEYGWLTIHAPVKAAEVKAGALETVHEGGIIFIESTAEGPYGDFKDMCDAAETMRVTGKELGPMDYRIHSFYWMDKESNQTDPQYVEIDKEQHNYFDMLEKVHGKEITLPQRAWYVAKKRHLKHLMLKEHPSTYEEFFIAAVEGAYYAEDIAFMREQGRICSVPHNPAFPVHTICDLGIGSHMPWIFFQVVGLEVHVIDEYAIDDTSGMKGGAPHFKRMLEVKAEKLRYNYGKYFVPFDAGKHEIGTGRAVINTFADHGIDFECLEVEHRVFDGIQRMANMLSFTYIDAERCPKLLMAWSSYHRQWIDRLDTYAADPADDKSSHFADAGRYLSKVIDDRLYSMAPTEDYVKLAAKYNKTIL
jgi:hypothetical protein